MRDPELAEGQVQVAHLGDSAGVQERLPLVREEGRHLGRRLQVQGVVLELHPARRVEVVARPDAQKDVVGGRLAAMDVVEVVRHDERQARLGGEPEELLVEALLLRHAVVLELQEEATLAQDVAVLAGQRPREVPVLDLERPGDLAIEAGRQADEALAVLGQVLPVDARLVVVAVDVGVGDEAAEVPVADGVRRQEDQVEGLGVGLALLVGHRPPGDVGLDPDDRLEALEASRLVEGDAAVEGPVIGEREAVEALHPGLLDQLRDPPEPVQEAELGVGVEMDEVVRGDGHREANGRSSGRGPAGVCLGPRRASGDPRLRVPTRRRGGALGRRAGLSRPAA